MNNQGSAIEDIASIRRVNCFLLSYMVRGREIILSGVYQLEENKVARRIFAIRLLRTGCGFVLLVNLIACSDYSVTGGPKPLVQDPFSADVEEGFEPLRINVVAVIPFQEQAEVGVSLLDAQKFTNELIRALELRSSLDLVEKAKVEDVVKGSSVSLMSPAQARLIGERLGCQGVLYGRFSKFVDSEGSSLGADKNAAIGFRLWLVDVKSAEVLWTGSYDKTNKPLSANLFEVGERRKEKFRFPTAVELVEQGFLESAKSLQELRAGKSQ